MKICFFTVANGENYSHMANTLAFAFKKHSEYTLQVFTNHPELINFGDAHKLNEFNHDNFMFKFYYIRKISELIDAEYYVFIDADSFIVKRIEDIENVIKQDPMHVFFENEFENNQSDWYGKRLHTLNFLFNEISQKNIKYYNVNGGFFGIQREYVNEIVDKAYKVRDLLKNKLTNHFTEEYILSFLAGEYIKNIDSHLLYNNLHHYAIDNRYFFTKKFPQNIEWEFKEWFSNKTYIVSPSIIHAPGNKKTLHLFSEELLHMGSNENLLKNDKKTLNINLIIACSRPYNLPLVIRSIEKQLLNNIEYKIWIIFDLKKIDPDIKILNWLKKKNNIQIYFYQQGSNIGGHAAKNFVIDKISDGWIYQLDDDNLLYPRFFERISYHINNNPDKKCFIFSQRNRYTPKTFEDIKCGIVDTAMYIFEKNFINNEKIPEIYGGDGMFIEKIVNQNPDKCMVIEETLCYYNRLEKF